MVVCKDVSDPQSNFVVFCIEMSFFFHLSYTSDKRSINNTFNCPECRIALITA